MLDGITYRLFVGPAAHAPTPEAILAAASTEVAGLEWVIHSGVRNIGGALDPGDLLLAYDKADEPGQDRLRASKSGTGTAANCSVVWERADTHGSTKFGCHGFVRYLTHNRMNLALSGPIVKLEG